MKKLLPAVTALLLCLLLLCGCTSGRLPDNVEADAVKDQAKKIVAAVNQRNYSEVARLFTQSSPLSVEEWKTSLDPILDKVGPFKEFKSITYVTTDSSDYGEVVVVMVETQYEAEKLVWQVNITSDYEVIGLFI